MAKKHPHTVEPEDESQETESQETENQEDDGGDDGYAVSKTDAIKLALKAGVHKPADGVKWIKDEYNIDVDNQYFSVTASKIRSGKLSSEPGGRAPRGSGQTGRSTTTEATRSAPPRPQQPSGGPAPVPDTLAKDLAQLGELITTVGGGDLGLTQDRVGRIHDLIRKYGLSQVNSLLELVNTLRS